MNHKRNAVRFAIVIFWVIVVGLIYSAFVNFGNAHVLGWFTWLIYVVITVVVLYAATVFTTKFWNIK